MRRVFESNQNGFQVRKRRKPDPRMTNVEKGRSREEEFKWDQMKSGHANKEEEEEGRTHQPWPSGICNNTSTEGTSRTTTQFRRTRRRTSAKTNLRTLSLRCASGTRETTPFCAKSGKWSFWRGTSTLSKKPKSKSAPKMKTSSTWSRKNWSGSSKKRNCAKRRTKKSPANVKSQNATFALRMN